MKKYEAVILAGGRAPWLLPLAGTDIRSLALIHGKPIIRYIMEALQASGRVDKIYVVTDTACLEALAKAGIEGYVPVTCNKPTLAEVGLVAANAVEADKPENHKIVFVCDDIPLLTAEAVNGFLDQCEAEPDGDMYYSIIRKETCEKQYPEGKRTYGPLSDGTFTGGNMTLLTQAAIAKTQGMAKLLYENRKHPVKLCELLGWWLVVRALCHCLSSMDVEKRCSEIMGTCCKAIITEHACIGMDMDKQADWELMNRLLG